MMKMCNRGEWAARLLVRAAGGGGGQYYKQSFSHAQDELCSSTSRVAKIGTQSLTVF